MWRITELHTFWGSTRYPQSVTWSSYWAIGPMHGEIIGILGMDVLLQNNFTEDRNPWRPGMVTIIRRGNIDGYLD